MIKHILRNLQVNANKTLNQSNKTNKNFQNTNVMQVVQMAESHSVKPWIVYAKNQNFSSRILEKESTKQIKIK